MRDNAADLASRLLEPGPVREAVLDRLFGTPVPARMANVPAGTPLAQVVREVEDSREAILAVLEAWEQVEREELASRELVEQARAACVRSGGFRRAALAIRERRGDGLDGWWAGEQANPGFRDARIRNHVSRWVRVVAASASGLSTPGSPEPVRPRPPGLVLQTLYNVGRLYGHLAALLGGARIHGKKPEPFPIKGAAK